MKNARYEFLTEQQYKAGYAVFQRDRIPNIVYKQYPVGQLQPDGTYLVLLPEGFD